MPPNVRVLEGEERERAIRESRAGLNRAVSRQRRAGNIKKVGEGLDVDGNVIDLEKVRTEKAAQALAAQKSVEAQKQLELAKKQALEAKQQAELQQRVVEVTQEEFDRKQSLLREQRTDLQSRLPPDEVLQSRFVPTQTKTPSDELVRASNEVTSRRKESLERLQTTRETTEGFLQEALRNAQRITTSGFPSRGADRKISDPIARGASFIATDPVFIGETIGFAQDSANLEQMSRDEGFHSTVEAERLRAKEEAKKLIDKKTILTTAALSFIPASVKLPKVVREVKTSLFNRKLNKLSQKDLVPDFFDPRNRISVIDSETGAVLPSKQTLLRPLEVDLPPPELITSKTPTVIPIRAKPPSASPPTPKSQTKLTTPSIEVLRTESGFIARIAPNPQESLRRARAAQETLALAKRKSETQLLIPQLPSKPIKSFAITETIIVDTPKGRVITTPFGTSAVKKPPRQVFSLDPLTAGFMDLFEDTSKVLFSAKPKTIVDAITSRDVRRKNPTTPFIIERIETTPKPLSRSNTGQNQTQTVQTTPSDAITSVLIGRQNLLDDGGVTSTIPRRHTSATSKPTVKRKHRSPPIPIPVLRPRITPTQKQPPKEEPKRRTTPPFIPNIKTPRNRIKDVLTTLIGRRTKPRTTKKTSSHKSFDVFVKRKGMFELLAKRASREAALLLGARRVRGTLAATFKLVENPKKALLTTKKQSVNLEDFRTFKKIKGRKVSLKNEFIQKRSQRLSSRGERKSILKAKTNNFLR